MDSKSYINLPKWRFNVYYSGACSIFVNSSNSFSYPSWYTYYRQPIITEIPYIEFTIMCYTFQFIRGDISYWNRWIWIHHFCHGDEDLAKNTWNWMSGSFEFNKW